MGGALVLKSMSRSILGILLSYQYPQSPFFSFFLVLTGMPPNLDRTTFGRQSPGSRPCQRGRKEGLCLPCRSRGAAYPGSESTWVSPGPFRPKALCVAAVEGTQRCHHLVGKALGPAGSREEQKHKRGRRRPRRRRALGKEPARRRAQSGGSLHPQSSSSRSLHSR